MEIEADVPFPPQAKSALTGMVLINEGRDGAGKQQMDLIMARAEAAGYGLCGTFLTSYRLALIPG